MLEDSFLGLVEDVDGQKPPMPSWASRLPFFLYTSEVMSWPEEPVNFRGDDPGRVVVQAHSPFNGYWNLYSTLRRRVSDRHYVGDKPPWKLTNVGMAEHNRARSAF